MLTPNFSCNVILLKQAQKSFFFRFGIFALAVSNILKKLNVKFEGVNVLSSDELRQGIKDFTDWPTIPQLYVKGEFVGGCDIVKEMFEKGELKKLFEDKSLLS